MGPALILIGIGCMIAAIVGGGVKVQQLEVGEIRSLWRQGLLGIFGILVSLFGFAINQDYFSASKSKVSSSDAPANSASPIQTTPPIVKTTHPIDAEASQTPKKEQAKPPAAQKQVAQEQAPLTMRDQNGNPVVDVTGLWIDEAGHRLRFAQTLDRVSINGGDESGAAGAWSGGGNLYRESRIQLDLMNGPTRREFCKGPTYKTAMVLTCENPDTGGDIRHTTLKKVG